VPIKAHDTGKIIAILGIDYPASEWYARIWKRMIPDGIIVISILLLFFALLRTWSQHSALKYLSEKLVLMKRCITAFSTRPPTESRS
jgi:hypothetical protein